jgi:hypothetical protein
MAINAERSDFQKWFDCCTSCESQIMGGNEEEARAAIDLLNAISPYSENWITRYEGWHREHS